MSFNLNKSKLSAIKGANYLSLNQILDYAGLNKRKKKFLSKSKQYNKINQCLRRITYAGTYINKVRRAKDFYIQINCFSGSRLAQGYPVRGQRTHTNAKTAKKFKLLLKKNDTFKKKQIKKKK
jgi:ribosomal protein S13